jgi:hypothetical protein
MPAFFLAVGVAALAFDGLELHDRPLRTALSRRRAPARPRRITVLALGLLAARLS